MDVERQLLCVCLQELEEFWPFKALLTELTRRLSYCVKAELIPLMEVAGVMEVSSSCHDPCFSFNMFNCKLYVFSSSPQSRAKQLYNAGYKTLAHLANADPAVLCRTIDNLYKKQANLMVASAKVSVLLLLCVRVSRDLNLDVETPSRASGFTQHAVQSLAHSGSLSSQL